MSGYDHKDNLPPWADRTGAVRHMNCRSHAPEADRVRPVSTRTSKVAVPGAADLYVGGQYVGKLTGVDIEIDQEVHREFDVRGNCVGVVGGTRHTVMRVDKLELKTHAAVQFLYSVLTEADKLKLKEMLNEKFDSVSPPPWAQAAETVTESTVKFKENEMKANHLIALLAQGYTTIKVRFPNSNQLYTYKARKGIQVNQFVVVDSPRTGMQCAQVMEVDDTPQIDVTSDVDYKWIVTVIDTSDYVVTIQREASFLAALEEVEQAKQREQQLKAYRESLPEGTEARQIFEKALSEFNGTPVLSAPETKAG